MSARAYSLLHVKTIDAGARRIAGIASTPEPDRMGDVIDMAGITFTNPVPLLLYHKSDRPVGIVTFGTPTADGLPYTAELPTIAEPGAVRDRVEEAWTSLREKLIGGVSIGFRAIEFAYDKVTGGLHFLKTEVLELSLVTVPANAGVTVQLIKSLDLAASGHPLAPGVAGRIVRADGGAGAVMKQTTTEQIGAFEATRAAKVARMGALMDAAGDARATLDDAQQTEYDGLARDVDEIDKHLVRLRAYEQTQIAAATRVDPKTAGTTPGAAATRGATPVITVRSNLPPAAAFVRAICMKIVCRGNQYEAAERARERWPDQPEIAQYLRAAVAPGTTTDGTWAGPLVTPTAAEGEFLELLRPATIIGKIPNLKDVPFNTKIQAQTGGGSYKWVGELKPKPLTKLAFGSQTLGFAKASGIIVISEELARLSSPSAETLVRNDMIGGIAQFLDAQFIDPAVAAVAGVNPGSITNGTTPITSTGPAPDILAIVTAFSAANMPLGSVTLIMSETNALAIGFLKNTDGSARYPGMGASGGVINGITVVTSNTAGTNVIGLVPERVAVAGINAPVEIDLSREASLQMSDAPMDPADATTVYVSLWQNNLVGLRAEKFANWARCDAAAVKYVTGANYGALVQPSEAPPATP